MQGTFSYSGLNTKIHGMKSKLLTEKDFSEMANQSSVPDVIRFLQNTRGYGEFFSDSADESFYHRESLEQILIYALYNNFARIYTFSTMYQRKFLDLYFQNFETRFLKQLLRATMNNGKGAVDTTLFKPFFERFSDIPYDKCISATTTEELINCLKDTKYYEPLMNVYNLPEKNLFNYEICLDLFKFRNLWKAKNKFLKGDDLTVVTDIFGHKIDLLNLEWIYRCKKYYNMTSAQILEMVIPIHYKLKRNELFKMVEADSVKSFTEILSTTYYGSDVSNFEDKSIEKYYDSLMGKYYNKIFTRMPYSLACVITYLYLHERETSNIILVTEGVRYSYPSDEILKLLKYGGDSI